MDMNVYALQVLARDRIAELRLQGERSGHIRTAKPSCGSLRMALGDALIRVGQRLAGRECSLLMLGVGRAVEPPRRPSTPEALRG